MNQIRQVSSFILKRQGCPMKIRQPWLLKVLGFAVACLVRLWIGTIRYRYRPLGGRMNPDQRNFQGRYLYAFWHENLLMPAYQYGRPDVWVLISQHADGELIASAVRYLGFKAVRGSTTRGGMEAVREMMRRGHKDHLAITPDGPRGPRRRVQPGLIYLAARTGLPIVPIGFAFRRAWRLNSWDRFVLPHPWSEVVCVTTEPISVLENAGKDELEAYRLRVEEAIQQATETAERWVGRRGDGKMARPWGRDLAA
jgi:lysophospholipid acyltransferase (LPLAT)-like uncharacterized protein